MKNNIPERIAEVRAMQGITREEFAGKIGCTHEYVRMMEQGKRTPRETLLLAICYRFGVREKWMKEGVGKRKA